MTTFRYFTAISPTGLLKTGDVGDLVDALARDQLVVLPTETGYLIAAMATSVDAVKKAFSVKQRDRANTMHIACSSLAMAQRFGRLNETAMRLLGQLTPGPVTVVVDHTGGLPDGYVTRDGTVGLRIPDHPATLQVISALGGPVTATSLNRSGEPSIWAGRHAAESLDWPPSDFVGVVEDPRSPPYSRPSTLVRVTGREPEILRPGPISEETVREIVARRATVEGAQPAENT